MGDSQLKLGEAQTRAEQQRFFEAVEACLPVLMGPDRAVDVLRRVCESWEKCQQSRLGEHQEEINSMTAQLMAARDRSEQLRQAKDNKDLELRRERERREEAETNTVWLRRRSQLYEEGQREISRLKQELREARSRPVRQVFSREDTAKRMAELECAPLLRCSSAEHAVLKKKLLLKWHPDKQPSADHATLATQVMQEMQNRPEWDY